MNEIWMEKLLGESSSNTVNEFTRSDKYCWVNILVVVTLCCGLCDNLYIARDLGIGDTKYNI